MLDKDTFGYLSLILAVVSLAPYLYSVIAGKTKPHVFTWVIWTLTTSLTAAAQYAGHAGSGAWATVLTALLTGAITLLAFTRGVKTITRSDWVTFIFGLSAIPLWYYTNEPLIAAVIAMTIDALAYYPTFRKSYRKPWEEMIYLYVACNIMHTTSFFAMEKYSLTTLLYPTTVLLINTALIAMLTWRRHQLKPHYP